MAPQVKSWQRAQDHGEVFTNEREVSAMLDIVRQETERVDSRFLEPACGDGNFLAEVLQHKLAIVNARYRSSLTEYEKYAFLAVGSILTRTTRRNHRASSCSLGRSTRVCCRLDR